MKLQILGTGCAKCAKLAEATRTAAEGLGVPFELEKVTDINAIIGFGVMVTPALARDGEVLVSGKVPSSEEIAAMLR